MQHIKLAGCSLLRFAHFALDSLAKTPFLCRIIRLFISANNENWSTQFSYSKRKERGQPKENGIKRQLSPFSFISGVRHNCAFRLVYYGCLIMSHDLTNQERTLANFSADGPVLEYNNAWSSVPNALNQQLLHKIIHVGAVTALDQNSNFLPQTNRLKLSVDRNRSGAPQGHLGTIYGKKVAGTLNRPERSSLFVSFWIPLIDKVLTHHNKGDSKRTGSSLPAIPPQPGITSPFRDICISFSPTSKRYVTVALTSLATEYQITKAHIKTKPTRFNKNKTQRNENNIKKMKLRHAIADGTSNSGGSQTASGAYCFQGLFANIRKVQLCSEGL